MKSFFKTYWTYFVSFIIPVVIMTGVYLTQGIHWNSDTSPLIRRRFPSIRYFDVALRKYSYMEMVVCFTPLQVASD